MIPFVGLASGIGGSNPGSGKGPLFIQKHLSLPADWKAMILPKEEMNEPLKAIELLNQELADAVSPLVHEGTFFVALGGDHSSGIGVWSGAASTLRSKGDIGLIWVDAHMDSHTPQTTESGTIHGMPLAVLLGHGEPSLIQIADPHPKIKPENLVLIGIRSYESGEAELLKSLNVRVYFMDEVKARGIEAVMKEAVEIVSRHTVGYGVSFDLDSIDPQYAPGVGTPVPGGIHPDEFLSSLSALYENFPIGFELVEYNPTLDQELKSLNFIQQLLEAISRETSIK